MFALFRKWMKPKPTVSRKPRRALLGVEGLEDRSVPAVVFTDVYTWNNATVTVTVDDNSPGQYHWNYNVRNDSFTTGGGIGAFAVPVEVAGMASNLASSAGWAGSPGGLMGDPTLVSWQAGAQPVLNIGQSANFSFTTAPTGLGLTKGFFGNAGLTTTLGGILAFPINAAPVPATPSLFVRTTTDEDNSTSLTLREGIEKINRGEMSNGQLVTEIRFAQGLTGQTITLKDPLPRIDTRMTIHGENRNVTVTRDATEGKFRLFEVGNGDLTQQPTVTIRNLTLKGGGGTGADGVSTGGAILSRAKLVLTNCTLRDNSATNGGAIFVEDGTLDIKNCDFFNNNATNGGAIFIYEYVDIADITDTLIHDNEATDGGGVYIVGGQNVPITLLGVHIYMNLARFMGGGVAVLNNQTAGGSPQLYLGSSSTAETVIESNFATRPGSTGGGVYLGAGDLFLLDGSINNNGAALGGGLYAVTGTWWGIMPDFTISDNSPDNVASGA